jgi:hypothetical protein
MAPSTAASSAESSVTGTVTGVASLVARVLAPVTVITAVLFYFGWARINAQAQYLGISESILGYSVQDYMLRAVSPLFLPVCALLLIGLVWLRCHLQVCAFVEAGTHTRVLTWLGRALVIGGTIVLAAGAWLSFISRDELSGWAPLMLAIGVVVVAYGDRVSRLRRRATGEEAGGAPVPYLTVALVVGLAGLATFWAVADYAQKLGRDYGKIIQGRIASEPRVTVYSAKNLQLDGHGITQTALSDPSDSAYRFRYDGMILLERTGNKFFLLPVGWADDGSVIVLPDDSTIRLEYQHTAG